MKTPRSLLNPIRLLGALLLTVLITASTATADSMARIVRLSYVDGANVQVDRNDSNGYSQAFANEPIVEGGSLWVGDDSHAEVQFEDGSTMRLGPNSAVNFNELRLGSSGHFSTMITVQEGVVYFNLLHRNDDQFRVVFSQYQIDVNKAAKFRIDGDQNELHVSVTSGAVDFVNANGARMDVRKNETLSFDLTDPTRPYMAREVATLDDDTWNQQRDDALMQQASASNYNGYSQYYSYGFNDLNNYGSYYDDPQYGSLWRPNNVGYGWDPFDAGYWVYYPLQGYVWVSAYPWGWAPYRYGSWVYVNNRGWCWRHNAHYYQQIAFTPRIVNPPANYSRLVLPNRPGANGGVVVVNRGPNDRSNPLFRSPGTGNSRGGVISGSPVDREHINTGGGNPSTPGSEPLRRAPSSGDHGGETVITNETLRTFRSSRGTVSGGENFQGNGGSLGVGKIPDTHPRPEPPANPEVQPERERRDVPAQQAEPRSNNPGGPAPRSNPEPVRPAPAPAATPRSAPVAPPAPRTPPPGSASKS